MITVDERMAKVEGLLEQMNVRLTQVEGDLPSLQNTKVDKWEVRIWFVFISAVLGAILSQLVTAL